MSSIATVAFALLAFVALSVVAIDTKVQCGVTKCPFGNNNCSANPACSRCNGPNGFNGVCVAGLACGSTCSGNGDCDQTGDCNICINGKCAAGCQAKCAKSSDCGAPCGTCINGTCQLWKCGSTCSKNGDCGGACGTCTNGKCMSECGNLCKANSDCPFGCGNCKNGICQAGGSCKSPCTSNLECTSSTCNQCINNTCAAGCGQKCSADTFCSPHTGCGKCVEGKCAPWTCGNACTTSSTCAGSCPFCDNTTKAVFGLTLGASGRCAALCGNYCDTGADCRSSCSSCVGNKCTKPGRK